MDEPCVILGANHRKYRHKPNTTPQEAKALFGKNADNACLDHIRLDELERRKKGIRKGSQFKEPSFVRLSKNEATFTYPIASEKPQGWVRTDEGIVWEQIIKRCPKCNNIFSSQQKTYCPFCGQAIESQY